MAKCKVCEGTILECENHLKNKIARTEKICGPCFIWVGRAIINPKNFGLKFLPTK